MPNHGPDEQAAAPTNLPVLAPSATTLVRRAQTTLGLLRDVMQESSAEYWYKRGKEAKANHAWEEGISAFRACIMRDFDHWRATLQLVVALMQQDVIAAAEALGQAYDMPYPEWKIWAAELSSEEWQMLRIYFENNKAAFPDDHRISFALSLVYQVIGGPEFLDIKALGIMESLNLDLLNSIPAFQRLIGYLEYRVQQNVYFDYEKSNRAFENSAAISKSASDFYSLGIAKEDAGWSLYDTVDDYKKAISIDNNHVYANFKLGEYYYEHHPADALTYFERVTKLAPDFAIAFLALGNCQERTGNKDAAIVNCKLALAIDSSLLEKDSYDTYNVRSILSTSDLIAAYDHIIEKAPDNATAFHKRGVLKFSLHDWAGGGADCRRSKELSGATEK